MQTAQQGDTVRFHYVGRLEDGTVFDATQENLGGDCSCDDEECGCGCGGDAELGPLETVIGSEEIIPTLEQALVGMAPGESKTVHIAAAEAYGPRDEELMLAVDRKEFPADIHPEVGQELEITDEDGEPFLVVVARVAEDEVILDANHPLADQDLTFDVTLVEIG